MQRNLAKYKVYGYQYTGYMRLIGSVHSYFEANMSLMLQEVRNSFCQGPPGIYQGAGRYAGTLWPGGQRVQFHYCRWLCCRRNGGKLRAVPGCKGRQGTVLRNCVIMQDSVIGAGCQLSYVIADKDGY